MKYVIVHNSVNRINNNNNHGISHVGVGDSTAAARCRSHGVSARLCAGSPVPRPQNSSGKNYEIHVVTTIIVCISLSNIYRIICITIGILYGI